MTASGMQQHVRIGHTVLDVYTPSSAGSQQHQLYISLCLLDMPSPHLQVVLTIKVVVIKGDAVRRGPLVHPQIQVLMPPGRVPLQVPQGCMGLLLTHLAGVIKLAFLHQLAHLLNTACSQ